MMAVETPNTPAALSDEDKRILALEFAGKTIGVHIEEAIAAGKIVRGADGQYQLAKDASPGFIHKRGVKSSDFQRSCHFLNKFMFQAVYGQAAVPWSCRDCYKVKIISRTLSELMAAKETSEAFPEEAKSGPDLVSPEHRYATFLYVRGLDKARALYRAVRARIDLHAKLGPSVKAIIKRGCTNYEEACGPSDRYTFDPKLAEIEDYFAARFKEKSADVHRPVWDGISLLNLVRTAYREGDATYKEFTGGEAPPGAGPDTAVNSYKLKPKVVLYSPE